MIHPTQDQAPAIGQPVHAKKGPLSSNATPTKAQASVPIRKTRPSTYAPVPAMTMVVRICTV